jgi:uncharacterized RDD family membrane protein YckC
MERPPRKGWRRLDPRPSIFEIALITFIVLKLTRVITWSWWWVLSPMWISGILTVPTLGGPRPGTQIWMPPAGTSGSRMAGDKHLTHQMADTWRSGSRFAVGGCGERSGPTERS